MTYETQMIRPIHYLGSKLRMLEPIKDALDSIPMQDGAVCDLFSGSGTVSKYLLQYKDVISVDIQRYSAVLAEASMGCLKSAPDVSKIMSEIRSEWEAKELTEVFWPLLSHEQKCMDMAYSGNVEPLYHIIEEGSLYVFEHEDITLADSELEMQMQQSLRKVHENTNLKSVDSMICRYYGGLYFSYQQAVALDTISHFIFKKTGLLHTKMLAALLSTASEIVNTVGKQFAQPLKVRDRQGQLKYSLRHKILTDRSQDVYEIFARWLAYYLNVGESEHDYCVLCEDFESALDALRCKKIAAVYADPPYTRYHYSRYYHVLETICLRDEPEISTTFPNGKGGISRAIYRADRYQSPFCIKSQAEEAFDFLFQKVRRMNVPLVLSYSPFDASKAAAPRVRTIDQLVEKAERYFSSVDVRSPGEFTHSKLNTTEKNLSANHEAELLIVCR